MIRPYLSLISRNMKTPELGKTDVADEVFEADKEVLENICDKPLPSKDLH